MGEERRRAIVVGIDFSELSAEALSAALGLAIGMKAIVHLVHVVPLPTSTSEVPISVDTISDDAQKRLAAVHQKALETAPVPVTARVVVGHPG
jgi:nucleotide-binding universal stress UspA family protein